MKATLRRDMIAFCMAGKTDSEILNKLDQWFKKELPAPIELYLRLTRLQIENKSGIKLPEVLPSPEVISERMSKMRATTRTRRKKSAKSRFVDIFKGEDAVARQMKRRVSQIRCANPEQSC